MSLKKIFQYMILMVACLMLSSCTKKANLDNKTSEATSATQEELVNVDKETFHEINEFMDYFLTFPVLWDFDQQDMSGALDFFSQKWVWTDVTELEYDSEADAFYASTGDLAEKMEQYFVMSESAQKAINEKAQQGRIKICADHDLPWFWGFSFEIDRVEEREGAYYVHGYNVEVEANAAQGDSALRLGGSADPFLEFNAVMVRNEQDGKLRLKELDGLEYGPGRKADVSQVNDTVRKELNDFAEIFLGEPMLEEYNINDLTEVFDLAAQKILQRNPEVVQEGEDGLCVVPLSELKSFMEQYFYLPEGFEKCLPKEADGKNTYPCLGDDGVIFRKRVAPTEFELRSDLPMIQNERYYSFGVYNVDAETLRNSLAAEGKDPAAINTTIKEQYPFELVVMSAVRGKDGKLRLIYFKPYYL